MADKDMLSFDEYKARVCERIRNKGNHIHSERGMQFYGLMCTIDQAIQAFNPFSYPKLSGVKKRLNVKGNLFCGFSLTNDNQIYSAVYIKQMEQKDECMLLSFYNHEASGWYLDMMAMVKVMVKRLLHFRIRVLTFRFNENWPIAPYVEKVFAQFGKTEIKTSHYKCTMKDTRPLLHSPWTNRPVPEGYTIEAWDDTSYTQLEEAFRQDRFKDIPRAISPFQLKGQFPPQYSSLIKHHQQIIGWCIIHTLSNENVQVTALYVEHKKGHGLGLRALRETCQRIYENERKYYQAIFLIEGINSPMHALYHKVLKPLGCKMETFHEIKLTLF